MTLRNLSPLFALVTGLVIVSCTPYPEEQQKPNPPADPAQNKTLTAEEQQKLKEERAKAAEEAQKKLEEEQKTAEGGAAGGATGGSGEAGGTTKPAGERKDWPFASPVPGKTGFVFSPYNNKVIDVRDIPSGMLVQDPTYPAAEKKYFRVP